MTPTCRKLCEAVRKIQEPGWQFEIYRFFAPVQNVFQDAIEKSTI